MDERLFLRYTSNLQFFDWGSGKSSRNMPVCWWPGGGHLSAWHLVTPGRCKTGGWAGGRGRWLAPNIDIKGTGIARWTARMWRQRSVFEGGCLVGWSGRPGIMKVMWAPVLPFHRCQGRRYLTTWPTKPHISLSPVTDNSLCFRPFLYTVG